MGRNERHLNRPAVGCHGLDLDRTRMTHNRPLHTLAPVLLAVLAAVSGCSLGSPPKRVPQQAREVPDFPLYGFDAGSALHDLPQADVLRDVRTARQLGATAVRVVLRWSWLEPSSGVFDGARAAQVDRIMATARKEGLAVIPALAFSPCWASTAPRLAGGGCSALSALYPPRDTADYAAFVARAVERWGKGWAGIEVWNEPNLPGFWRGSPDQYVSLVRAAAEAVDTTPYADLPVGGGSLSGSDVAYLQRLLGAGLSRWSDAVSIHPYDVQLTGPGFGDPAVARPGDNSSFGVGVPAIRSALVAAGDDDPIWITEFGEAVCPAAPYCVTAEDQGRYLATAMTMTAEWPYVSVFLVYRLRDWYGPGEGIESHFGLLNGDWSPKAGAETVERALKSLSE